MDQAIKLGIRKLFFLVFLLNPNLIFADGGGCSSSSGFIMGFICAFPYLLIAGPFVAILYSLPSWIVFLILSIRLKFFRNIKLYIISFVFMIIYFILNVYLQLYFLSENTYGRTRLDNVIDLSAQFILFIFIFYFKKTATKAVKK